MGAWRRRYSENFRIIKKDFSDCELRSEEYMGVSTVKNCKPMFLAEGNSLCKVLGTSDSRQGLLWDLKKVHVTRVQVGKCQSGDRRSKQGPDLERLGNYC